MKLTKNLPCLQHKEGDSRFFYNNQDFETEFTHLNFRTYIQGLQYHIFHHIFSPFLHQVVIMNNIWELHGHTERLPSPFSMQGHKEFMISVKI